MLRQINIRPVLNGFVVQVGCQELAYSSITRLTDDLHRYLSDPSAAMKKLAPEFINRKHTHPHDFDAFPVPAMPPNTPPPSAACGVGEPTRWHHPAPVRAEQWEANVTVTTTTPPTPPPPPEPRFSYGEHVIKATGDYTFDGTVTSVFRKLSGAVRYCVESRTGVVHIFNESQLQPVMPTATATATAAQ